MKPIGFIQSLSYIATGWRLLRTPGLRRFVWMPFLVNLFVFGLLGWWLSELASQWLNSLSIFVSLNEWWIVRALQSVLQWLLGLVLLLSLAFLFTLLANLIGAPFNGLLAERVEAHLTNRRNTNDPSWLTLIKSTPRLMASELSKLLYLLAFLMPLLLLQFVPVINLLAPLIIFLFGAWIVALEYMDYPLGNHGALFRDVRKVMRQRRRAALGFGSGIAVLSTIPLLNLFVMPIAVAGATALYVDHLQDLYPLDHLNNANS